MLLKRTKNIVKIREYHFDFRELKKKKLKKWVYTVHPRLPPQCTTAYVPMLKKKNDENEQKCPRFTCHYCNVTRTYAPKLTRKFMFFSGYDERWSLNIDCIY